MLITLICVAVFGIGLFMAIFFRDYWDGWRDKIKITGTILAVIGGFAVLIVGVMLIFTHVNPTSNHLRAVATRESYVRILESNDSIYTDTDFYESVIDWNKDIYDYKVWGSNAWTNWFWCKEVFDGLEPIELR